MGLALDCVTVLFGRFWTFQYQGFCKFALVSGCFQSIGFFEIIISFNRAVTEVPKSLSSTIQKQQLFWIGNHFEADVRQSFADTLSKAIEQGYTKEMLADTLKDQFSDLANRSSHYWQGLAEHTALRIREFGRLQGYRKAKTKYYKLLVILDDRTSDICRAWAAQDMIYPLNDANDVMDKLMALDTKSNSLDDARDYIKALAPWIKDDQIEYGSEMNPVGISGAHTPFPPFHWKCRT